MMCIVVDDGDSTRFTQNLKTPANAAKFSQCLADFVKLYPHLQRHDDRGHSVTHVVPARHPQPCQTEQFSPLFHQEITPAELIGPAIQGQKIRRRLALRLLWQRVGSHLDAR